MKRIYSAMALIDAAWAALGVALVLVQLAPVVLAVGACTPTSTTASSGTPQDAQQQAKADPNKQRKPEPKGY